MKLYHIISILCVGLFLGALVLGKNNRRFYLLFIFWLFPFIDLPVTPAHLGGFKVFDIVSYVAMFTMSREFLPAPSGKSFYTGLFIALFITLVLGSLNSLFMKHSLSAIAPVLPIFIFSRFLINELEESPEFMEIALNAIKSVVLISIAFLFMQIAFGLGITFYSELNRNTTLYDGIRYPSFFHDPQKFGQYMVLTGFLFLYSKNEPEKFKPLNIALFVLCIFALLQTGGRSALIAVTVGLLILFTTFELRIKIGIAAIAVAGAVLLITQFPSLLIFDRIGTLSSDYEFRAALWDEAKGYFMREPWLGIGIGNYAKYAVTLSSNYYIDELGSVIFFDQPESGYWMILTETGVIGAVIAFLFFFLPIKNAVYQYINVDRNRQTLLLIAAISSWMVTFISVYSIIDNRIFIMVATILSLLITSSRNEHNNDFEIVEANTHEEVGYSQQ